MLFLFITSKTNWLTDNEIKNVHMKFEIDEILKWIEAMLLKPSTEGRTKWIQYTPQPTSLGGGGVITKHDKTVLILRYYIYMGYTLWNKKDILKSQEITVDMTCASCSGQMH